MTKSLSIHEKRAGGTGRRQPGPPGTLRLTLALSSVEDVPATRLAEAALVALVAELWARPAPASLAADEQAAWEAVGADFAAADETMAAGMARTAMATAELAERSLDGDAAVADLLGVTKSRVSQRLADGSLYAYGEARHRHYPRWQFQGERTLPGLKHVLAALDHPLHPLVIDHWFTTPHADLQIAGAPVSPVTWLASGGELDVVVDLAAAR